MEIEPKTEIVLFRSSIGIFFEFQETASEEDLKKIVKEYFDRWFNLEGEMFLLQREVILRDLQVNKLTSSTTKARDI